MRLMKALAVNVAKFGTHLYDLSVLHMKTRNVALVGQLCCYQTAYEANLA
jgi:hypothetical protein